MAQSDEAPAHIEITLENIENSKGLIAINVFTTEDGFPSKYDKAYYNQTFNINIDSPTFILNDLPSGDYAVSVLHDENSNYKLDTNFFGIPKEGYAVSNNAKPGKFGPPKYKDAVFSHNSNGTKMTLRLRY